MMKSSLSLAPLLFVLSFAACSSSTADGTTSPDADAAAPQDGATTPDDGGTPAADSAPMGPSYGKTANGKSCDPASYPAATTSCAIEGTYTVVESDCSNAACGPSVDLNYTWTADVTVTGSVVKLTNGYDRLIHCQLGSGCDCLDTSGHLYRFTENGFLNTDYANCGATAYVLVVGTKQ